MKTHTKKKAYRAACKQQARADRINNSEGQWIKRSAASDNSMKRDYHPQSGKA